MKTRASKAGWRIIGHAAMDSGQLVISDPCYTLGHIQNGSEPEFTYADCCGDPEAPVEFKRLCFKRRYLRGFHEGAGIQVHSPFGDGRVEVWAKLTVQGQVSAVFFSFDGQKPPGKKAKL